MTGRKDAHDSIHSTVDQEWVLSTLELDQLAGAKRQAIPRRRLTVRQNFVLWSLRIYLLFMVAVVLYQIMTGGK